MCVCVCGGGGGGGGAREGITHPILLSTESPREEDYVALWPLQTHSGARKIYITSLTCANCTTANSI